MQKQEIQTIYFMKKVYLLLFSILLIHQLLSTALVCYNRIIIQTMKSGIAFNNTEELKYKAEDQVQVKEVIRLPIKVTLLQSKTHQKSITHSNIKTQLFATHIIHSQQEPSRVLSVEPDLENERRKTRQIKQKMEKTQEKLEKDLQGYSTGFSQELVEDYCRIHFQKMAMQTAIDRFALQAFPNLHERTIFMQSFGFNAQNPSVLPCPSPP